MRYVIEGDVVDMNLFKLRAVMKKLREGDRIEIGYRRSSTDAIKYSKYTVTSGFEKAGGTTHVGIIGKGTPYGRFKGQGGSIMDYGDYLVFQSTINMQVTPVLSLKKL